MNAMGMMSQMGQIVDRQAQRQEQLTDYKKSLALNNRFAKDMGTFNHNMAMKMWNETNYGAQTEHMRKAGLNVGLMYDGGGQGGQLMNPGGSAQGVNIKAEGKGLDPAFGLMNAQIENIKADTEQKKATTEKTKGVDTEETKSRIADIAQGIENKKAQEQLTQADTWLKQLEGEITGETKEAQIDRTQWEAKRAEAEAEKAFNEAYVGSETREAVIRTIKLGEVEKLVRIELQRAQTRQTGEQTQLTRNQARKVLKEIENISVINDQKDKEIALEKFKAELQSEYPGLFQTGGKILNEIVNFIQVSTGSRGNYRQSTVPKYKE